jgi:hypothetical protein
MDAYGLIATVNNELSYFRPEEGGERLGDRPGFKTCVRLDTEEVERVGRSLAALFGITLDETDGEEQ